MITQQNKNDFFSTAEIKNPKIIVLIFGFY